MASVLLVDDDVNLLRGLARALREQPYDVFTASSAEDAMEMCKRHSFDLVVSDQKMSGKSGTEFVSWLAEHLPKTVRIMLTGHAQPDMMMDAINNGKVFKFLVKPCHEFELAMAIREGLELREASPA